MKPALILLFTLLVSNLSLSGQILESPEFRLKCKSIIDDNNIGEISEYGTWTKEGGEKLTLTYLGKVQICGELHYVLTSFWEWGLSHRGTSRILIFNQHQKLVSNCSMGNPHYLPKYIENNSLFFSYDEKSKCNSQRITEISMFDGIPKMFFLACSDGMGNHYFFN